jgi:hypothetical protein
MVCDNQQKNQEKIEDSNYNQQQAKKCNSMMNYTLIPYIYKSFKKLRHINQPQWAKNKKYIN